MVKGCLFPLHVCITAYHLKTSDQEFQAGIWSQKLKQRPWQNTAWYLGPHSLGPARLSNSRLTVLWWHDLQWADPPPPSQLICRGLG